MDEAKVVEAETCLAGFWGISKSNGGAEAFAQCRQQIEALGLGKRELRELRLRLPFAETNGLVAGRVSQLKEFLDHMEG